MNKLTFIGTVVITSLLVLSGSSAFAAESIAEKTMNVALVGSIVPFVTAVAILLIIFYFRAKNQQKKYEVLEKAIERGVEVPPNFFQVNDKQTRGSKLETAFALIAVGIGLVLLGIFNRSQASVILPIASIPFLIGIGKLLAYKIEKKQSTAEAQEDE